MAVCHLLVAGLQRTAVRGRLLITRQSSEAGRRTRLLQRRFAAVGTEGVVAAGNTRQFTGLAEIIGQDTAEQEVKQALEDLGMEADEIRPGELRRLREQIERNLSGLLGLQMAHIIINRQLAMDSEAKPRWPIPFVILKNNWSHRTELKGLNADMDTRAAFTGRFCWIFHLVYAR